MKLFIFLSVVFFSGFVWAGLKVVTTTADLAALVQTVAGDHVDVFSIAKGTQDAHQIEAKPSFMVKMRDADLVLAQGLELETAWIQPLINGARNPKIKVGGPGFLELGDRLEPIEIPQGTVTRALGDVHPGGNPHFQLDPIRLGQAAVLIAEKLGELDANNLELYKKNALELKKRFEEKTKLWAARIEKTKLKEVVTYHKTLGYFLDRFKIKGELNLEPRPGLPPTAGHLLDVISEMKKRKIRLVLVENYYSDEASGKLKQDLPDVRVLKIPVSVGAWPELKTNEDLLEKIVTLIEDASK